ncbi:MAG: phosphate ABC transporter substrate-binding protein [Candidatus Odinarchaeum yellowstonii]|uniref:Phosphate ABC transporter substrate-binding protein n=1 Tax=Odinarchaeota yellowstonii (strain LCB_4) TaxID=1841599 RepID=A0AAF0D3U5_ODILC|nr:MAG: phosphate ABC transporter substrate-binding protein [Candidatus Odinarchaeum yellowstonii]
MMPSEQIGYGKAFLILALVIGVGVGAGTVYGVTTLLAPAQDQNVNTFSTTINIKGSDTLLELMRAWGENYTAQNPGVTLTVAGGGSGTGIAALINKQIDIATASRPAKASEIADAAAVGVTLVQHKVVIDGIAIITNPAKPISNITFDLLRGIYNGTITDWSQVNSSYSGLIKPYGRQSTSGTYAYFQEHVMKNDDYAPSVQQLAGNSDIIYAVAHDANGIGYVGAAYAEAASGIHIVAVNDPNDPVSYYLPTIDNIRTFTYPIARFLYLYTDGYPTGYIQAFIAWCQSPQGQAIALQKGYVPLYELP